MFMPVEVLLQGKDEIMNKKKKSINSINKIVRNKYGTGIRSYLTNSGFDNSKIGYDSENNQVTYNGKAVITPDAVVDGVSYADEDKIKKTAVGLHNASGKNLVPASDYVTQKTGISNLATSDGEHILINGKLIAPVVGSDENGFVDKSTLNRVISDFLNETGIKTEAQIYDNWKAQQEAVQNAIDRILDETWSYDPEDDPAYEAYANMYKREGERAFENAFGNAIANTDGYTNSAALSAAANSMDYYMQQLSDRVPELMQNSYERFSENRAARLDAINSIMENVNDSFEYELKANSSYIDRLNEANIENNKQKLEREKWEQELKRNNADLYKSAIESALAEIELEYAPASYELEAMELADKKEYNRQKNILDLAKQQADNENYIQKERAALTQTIIQNAAQRGYFLDEEADYIGLDKNDSRRKSVIDKKEEEAEEVAASGTSQNRKWLWGR